jgi:hypothetical protein
VQLLVLDGFWETLEQVMYKFLAYEWLMDWPSIKADHIVDLALKTQCQMCILEVKQDEHNFQFYVFGFAYLSLDDLSAFIEASGFRKGRWLPLSQEEFSKGKHIDFSEKGRSKTKSFFRSQKYDLNVENNEFHKRMKTDWRTWIFFKTDWTNKPVSSLSAAEKIELEATWQQMYDIAQEMNSLLGFVVPARTPRIRRLLLPFPSYENLIVYIEKAAPHLPLSVWSLILRKDVPNTLTTHSWKPGLVIENK